MSTVDTKPIAPSGMTHIQVPSAHRFGTPTTVDGLIYLPVIITNEMSCVHVPVTVYVVGDFDPPTPDTCTYLGSVPDPDKHGLLHVLADYV